MKTGRGQKIVREKELCESGKVVTDVGLMGSETDVEGDEEVFRFFTAISRGKGSRGRV